MLVWSTRIFLLITLFTVAIKAQTVAPTPPSDIETERIFTEEIKLNVSAVDRNGKFFPGVNKEDLVIIEDERLNQASSLRRIPANVLIVMDTGGEMRSAKSFDKTKKIAAQLIGALQADDSISIMQYHDRVEIIAEWMNKEDALKILKSKANFGRRSMFIEALDTATKFLQKSPLENRHLVLITDGTDTFNRSAERQAAMRNLLATDINVHVFSYTKLELVDIEPRTKGVSASPRKSALPAEVAATLPNGARDVALISGGVSINTDRAFLNKMRERKAGLVEAEKYLTDLSKDTNGELILAESNDEMLEKTGLIAAIIDSSYVLSYTPKRPLSESPDGEVRNIQISSRRPNLQVQARRKLIVKNNQ